MRDFIDFVKFIITLAVTIVVMVATHSVAEWTTDCIVGKVIGIMWKNKKSGEEDDE